MSAKNIAITTAATIAALFIANVVLMGMHMATSPLFGLPSFPQTLPEQEAFVRAMPLGAQLFLVFSYATAAFVGGWLASWWARPQSIWPAVAISILFTASGVWNFTLMPHPMCLIIVSTIVLAVMPLVGYPLRPKRSTMQG